VLCQQVCPAASSAKDARISATSLNSRVARNYKSTVALIMPVLAALRAPDIAAYGSTEAAV
jgi:hypothetical protein